MQVLINISTYYPFYQNKYPHSNFIPLSAVDFPSAGKQIHRQTSFIYSHALQISFPISNQFCFTIFHISNYDPFSVFKSIFFFFFLKLLILWYRFFLLHGNSKQNGISIVLKWERKLYCSDFMFAVNKKKQIYTQQPAIAKNSLTSLLRETNLTK